MGGDLVIIIVILGTLSWPHTVSEVESDTWEQVHCDWYYCCITKLKLNTNYQQSFISIIYNRPFDSTNNDINVVSSHLLYTDTCHPHLVKRTIPYLALRTEKCLIVGSVPSLIRISYGWHLTDIKPPTNHFYWWHHRVSLYLYLGPSHLTKCKYSLLNKSDIIKYLTINRLWPDNPGVSIVLVIISTYDILSDDWRYYKQLPSVSPDSPKLNGPNNP